MKGNNKSARRRKARARPPALAVDQHINFSEKFVLEALEGKTENVKDKTVAVGTTVVSGQCKCVICDVYFGNTKHSIDVHLKGKPHRHRCLLFGLIKNKERFINNVEVSICPDKDKVIEDGCIRFELDAGVKRTVSLTIKNNCPNDVIELKKCEFLKWIRGYKLSGTKNINSGKETVKIAPGESYDIIVTVQKNYIGNHDNTLAFLFVKEGEPEKKIHLVRFLKAKCVNRMSKELGPTSPYTKPLKVTLSGGFDLVTEDGLPLPPLRKNPLEREVPLPTYPISDSLRKLINRGLKENPDMGEDEEIILRPLAKDGHKQKFDMLLHIEEMQMEVDIRKYDMEKVTMEIDPAKRRLLKLHVPGLSENRPSVLKGDCLFVRCVNADGVAENIEYKGYVHVVELNHVYIGFSEKLRNKHVKGMKYNVRFTFNRFPMRLMHRAAQLAEEHTLTKLLFPTSQTVCTEGTIVPTSERLYFFDRKLESNAEQKAAVQHILAGSSRPAPYIVFGPPGTGKTVTIVEAIKQIHKHIPSAHVLACAPSNAAADLLALRLLNHIPPKHILRMYASSRQYSVVPDKLKPVCNWNNEYDSFEFQCKKDLQTLKVVVCTLITAGRLVSANFPPGHFSHVFIDESGHAVEPEAIIPIAGVLESDIVSKDGGQLVLAGDPKQLGPILRSPVAIKYGLGISFLERMMKISVYEKQKKADDSTEPDTARQECYNEELVTKLIKNYRSHPDLLKLPNEMFYDNDLEPHADEMVRESLCSWEHLPKKGFPLIFHGIVGEDQREEKSPSFFNAEEAVLVVEYVEKLVKKQGGVTVKPSDIGIISPYRRQVQKIQKALASKNLKDIQVGSTEEFQGQERLVIILSTVRSNPNYLSDDLKYNLGFLRNAKRFNVAVTRAKALLIVIGNPYMLAKDKHWNRLLEYCVDNGAYCDTNCEYSSEGTELDKAITSFKNMQLEEDDLVLGVSAIEQEQEPRWRGDD